MPRRSNRGFLSCTFSTASAPPTKSTRSFRCSMKTFAPSWMKGSFGSIVNAPFLPTGPSCEARRRIPRSEEHTSELQSQSNLVCRLLLEKKKKYIISTYVIRLQEHASRSYANSAHGHYGSPQCIAAIAVAICLEV